MSLNKVVLKVGSVVWFNDQRHEVVSLSVATVTVRSMRAGELSVVSTAELLTADGFSAHDASERRDSSLESQALALLDTVPEAERKKALELLRHLLEVVTGYQSGTEESPRVGEPRREYDISGTTLTQRIDAKAKELGLTSRAVWKFKSAYDSQGVWGLVDRRTVRLQNLGPAPQITHAIDRIVRRLKDESNVTEKRVIGLVKTEIRESAGLPVDFVMPSDATLRRYLLARDDGRQLFKSAKSRRNASNRPKHAYTRFHATRPGEVVLIDSTPLDAFVRDPLSLKPISIRFTIAIDLYTRSIVGWRFSMTDKAVDAALLLGDIISPKRSREFFGDFAVKPFVGIPHSIVTRLEEDGQEGQQGRLVPIPFLHPESLLIDQGRVYLSETFLRAAAELGINVMLARPYTPTDKAHVERMFKTIRENFVEALPGYKGRNVETRGKNPEENAFYFPHEIDEYFREWVATYWQVRTHDGLFLPVEPTLELTPNQMLEQGIARAGFLHVLPRDDLRYKLLPIVWRKIHHYGVDIGLLRYDSPDLDPFRNQPSPYPNSSGDKWPFHQDPRDRSVLFFFDTELREWKEIPWIGAKIGRQPFDDKMLQMAKDIAFQRINDVPGREEVEGVLSELLARIGNVPPKSRAARERLAAAMEKERKQRERDASKVQPPSGVASQTTGTGAEPSVLPAGIWSLPEIPRHLDIFEERDADDEALWSEETADIPAKATPSQHSTVVKPVDEAFEDSDDDLAY